jgi:hypothetical protein
MRTCRVLHNSNSSGCSSRTAPSAVLEDKLNTPATHIAGSIHAMRCITAVAAVKAVTAAGSTWPCLVKDAAAVSLCSTGQICIMLHSAWVVLLLLPGVAPRPQNQRAEMRKCIDGCSSRYQCVQHQGVKLQLQQVSCMPQTVRWLAGNTAALLLVLCCATGAEDASVT